MTKKHYITIAICSLVIVIASFIFGYYYKEYVKPESYTIGVLEEGPYKKLVFADYYSDEDIIFSQNIHKNSFVISDNIATYEYNFDHKKFDGIKNSYMLYVNDYMVNNITSDAGTISGIYTLNYYDVDKSVLCSSDITINFSFYSLASKLQVSLPKEDLGYLSKFFKTDNFIITLATNPFLMQDKEGEIDEKINEITQLTLKVEELNGTVATLNSDITAKQAEIEALKSSNEDKSEEISQLEAEVNSLKATIYDLEYTISYYEKLLEAYENSQKLSVAFKIDNDVYEVQLVDEGDYIKNVVSPTFDGYKFLGWSLDGVNVIEDITTIQVFEDITFTALKVAVYNVSFNVQGEEVFSEEVEQNGRTTYGRVPTLSGWSFYGWSTTTSIKDIVDIANLSVTENYTLNAIFCKSVVKSFSDNGYFEGVQLDVASGHGYYLYSFNLGSYINISNLKNCGYEYLIDVDYIYHPYSDSKSFHLKITNSVTEFDLNSGNINYTLPFYLTNDNKLIINSRDGSNPFVTFDTGYHRFNFNNVFIFTF